MPAHVGRRRRDAGCFQPGNEGRTAGSGCSRPYDAYCESPICCLSQRNGHHRISTGLRSAPDVKGRAQPAEGHHLWCGRTASGCHERGLQRLYNRFGRQWNKRLRTRHVDGSGPEADLRPTRSSSRSSYDTLLPFHPGQRCAESTVRSYGCRPHLWRPEGRFASHAGGTRQAGNGLCYAICPAPWP